MCMMSRDECDNSNALACPLRTTVEEVPLLDDYMRKNFPARYESTVLYHYTKPNVVAEFMKDDADLWCTYFGHLNDCREWYNGIEYISEYLRQSRRSHLADVINSLPEKTGCAPWICCFSQYADKASMWGMYADRSIGGYAVGFDRNRLLQRVKLQNERSVSGNGMPGDEYYLLPCLYLGDRKIDGLIEYILSEFHTDEDERLYREGCDDEVCRRQLERLFFLSLILKDPSFDYENEWRLIIKKSNVKQPLQSGPEVYWSPKAYIKSHLFDNPLREYISRVVVSPCGADSCHRDYAEMNYQWLCELSKRFNGSFKIARSTSSYNGR